MTTQNFGFDFRSVLLVLPIIDDFGVSDAIDETYMLGCKSDFGTVYLHKNPLKSRKCLP